MAEATDNDRALMAAYFGGEGIDDWPPTKFLLDNGYRERGGWWKKPTPEHAVTEKEYNCLNFLCDEWDHAYDFTVE